MNTYDPGDKVHIYATFTDLEGTAADPDTVHLDVRLHSDPEPTTYLFDGSTPPIERTATGEYHAVLEPEAGGLWHYGWRAEGGDAQGAEQGDFIVRPWRPGTAEATS